MGGSMYVLFYNFLSRVKHEVHVNFAVFSVLARITANNISLNVTY